MITFIFFDLAIVGFLVLFLLSLLGTGISSVFNVLPEYINIIALIIFIAQIIKLFIFIRYENFKIDKLTKKKITLDPDNSSKEYTIELVKKLDCIEENDNLIFTNIKNIGFAFLYDLLTRKAKRDFE